MNISPKKTTSRSPFWVDFKTFFGRGLAVLLPTVLTLWIVVQAYLFVESRIAQPINRLIQWTIVEAAPRIYEDEKLPEALRVTPEELAVARADAKPRTTDAELVRDLRSEQFTTWWESFWITRFTGMLVAISLIYLAGRILGGFLGRKLYGRIERFITAFPVFKQVYPHVKQVVEFLFGGEQNLKFNRVVLVEYPRKGIWTVGLMTGSSMRAIGALAGDDCVTVFIPSSPTPFTGYTITVQRADAIDLPMTIDEALRFVVTGGVLIPEGQAMPVRAVQTPTAPEVGSATSKDEEKS